MSDAAPRRWPWILGGVVLAIVLIAGVVHGARSTYPELGDHLVKQALKRLEDRGRAKVSAGRWSLADRRR